MQVSCQLTSMKILFTSQFVSYLISLTNSHALNANVWELTYSTYENIFPSVADAFLLFNFPMLVYTFTSPLVSPQCLPGAKGHQPASSPSSSLRAMQVVASKRPYMQRYDKASLAIILSLLLSAFQVNLDMKMHTTVWFHTFHLKKSLKYNISHL